MPYAERMFFLLGLGILLISIGWFVLVYLPEDEAPTPNAAPEPVVLPESAPPVVPAIPGGGATEGEAPPVEAPMEMPAPEAPSATEESTAPAPVEEAPVPAQEPVEQLDLAPGTTIETLPESIIPKVEDQRNAPVQMLQLRDAAPEATAEGEGEPGVLD